MYIEKSGDPDGAPIIYLHGGMVSGWMWTDIIQRLNGYHNIVVDFPGVHRSNDTPWESLDDTAEQIAEIIRAQGRPVHLVGLSLGAVIGLHVMNKVPELVDHAVLSGPVTKPVTGVIVYVQKVVLWLYSMPSTVSIVARILQIPEDGREALAEIAATTPKATNDRIMEEVYRQPLPPDMKPIAMPTLIVTGERDMKITRDSVAGLADSEPMAQGFFAPKVGHQWSAEDPALFTDMVEAWITDQPLPDGLIPIE